MSGGAVVIRRQNQYMELFNRKGAVDAEHAIGVEEIGYRRNFIFNRMVSRGIFVECTSGRFYIDNEAAARFRAQRREKERIILGALVVFFVIYYLTRRR